MDKERWTATAVGVLYIVGTGAGIASAVAAGGLSATPDSLKALAVNPTPATAAAALVLVMAVALAIIPALIYPVLKRESEPLAVGYVVFRGALEVVTHVGCAVCWLVLAGVAGMAVVPGIIVRAQESIGAVGAVVFSISGLILYYVLFKARLVPRWLAVWGLAGAALYLAGGAVAMVGGDAMALYMPLALQEMVMAVWLIVKGFSVAPTRLASLPVAA